MKTKSAPDAKGDCKCTTCKCKRVPIPFGPADELVDEQGNVVEYLLSNEDKPTICMKEKKRMEAQQTPPIFTKAQFTLFITGFVQVFFVSLSTYFIAHEIYLGAVLSSFMISMIWTYNVKKIAFGTLTDRIIYAVGACGGTIIGLVLATLINN